MPKHLLHVLKGSAIQKHLRGEGVSQVVEMEVHKPRTLHSRSKGIVDFPPSERITVIALRQSLPEFLSDLEKEGLTATERSTRG